MTSYSRGPTRDNAASSPFAGSLAWVKRSVSRTSYRNGVHHANGVVWEAVSPSVRRRHAFGLVPPRHRVLVAHPRVEERVHRLLRRRDRDELLIARGARARDRDAAFHAVVERDPLRESLDVLPDARVLGVEQVRAVLGRADAVLRDVIVAVPADVISLVDDDGGHPELGAASLREDRAAEGRSIRSDDVGVEFIDVRGGVERRRGRGLNARDPGRRDAPGKVLKDRRSPRRRGRMGTGVMIERA
eukprot:31174-Pelagococcus_subviridis.AAC.4